MAGIYLHVPFCKQACHYCDFHFSVNQELRTRIVEAMATELTLQRSYLNNGTVKTIYFGGGTPSLLSATELKQLLSTVRGTFSVVAEPEVTLEANPDDLTPGKLSELRALGVNRLSIGIQTFHDDLLRYLNRAHNSQVSADVVATARGAGFDNISIDLIYAIPGQSEEMWCADIARAIDLQPEHISCYSLTIEPQTVFGAWKKQGRLAPVHDDVSARYFELLMDALGAAGYEHYEVSNFAKPGCYSKHNTAYWQRAPYLGIGPSAHSYNLTTRQFNIANNHAYLRALDSNEIPATQETLSREDHVNEYLLTRLRTQWGCDCGFLLKEYNYDILRIHKQYVDTLISRDLARLTETTLTLTRKGKLLADKIASDLFL